jgi:hypothetical protein
MEDKQLDGGAIAEEIPQQANDHEHLTDSVDGGHGQSHSPRQPVQDGKLHPPENPAHAVATVVPSPLNACHPSPLSSACTDVLGKLTAKKKSQIPTQLLTAKVDSG